MEINVTKLVEDRDNMIDYSASVHECGDNVGRSTWQNAMEATNARLLSTPDEYDTVRGWLAGFGAWDSDEIEAFTDVELNALLLQFVAGDIRELEHYDTDSEFLEAQTEGDTSGRLTLDPDTNTWYFYVGD